MAKPQQVLILEPNSELIFKGPFTECVDANLTLTNPSSRDVYFKVKTTAPKVYCVRPNSGIIMANNKTQINVMLQPVETPEALENERNRHKFMIQTAFAPEDNQPTSVEQFWKTVEPSMVMDSKLRVVFQRPFGFGDGKEGDHHDPSNTFMSTKEYPIASESQANMGDQHFPIQKKDLNELQVALQKEIELRRMYQDEKTNLEKENYAMMEKIEEFTRIAAAVGSIQQDNVPLLQAILFAVLALLLGLFIGKMLL